MLYPTELRARPFSDCTPQNSPQKSLVREGSQFAFVFHSPFTTPSLLKVFEQAQLSISFEQPIHFHVRARRAAASSSSASRIPAREISTWRA